MVVHRTSPRQEEPDIERFAIVEHAGAGGMGAVYRAIDRESGETVALKVLKGSTHEGALRFAREAQVLAELRHPGIVRYVSHGVGRSGELYIAMEWLSGESLAQRLAREGLTRAESLALVVRVTEALEYAHERGIVHRDLKPSNLYLVDKATDRLKLIDFGIARRDGSKRELTMTGMLLGTPSYLSPEQARGEDRLDGRADVYSLGCLLFKCLTGRTPFEGDDALSVLLKVVMEEAPRLRDLCPDAPPALDDLCARMLSKTPEERPESAAAVARMIAALGSLPEGAGAPRSEAPLALTLTERRLLCMVLAQARHTLSDAEPTFGIEQADARERQLRAMLERYRTELHVLADGTLLITIEGPESGLDQVARAARCALELRAILEGAPVALVAGRAVASPSSPVSEFIERGARLLAAERASGVRVDDVTSALLNKRFDVVSDAFGSSLVGERDREPEGVTRLLLGRPTACVGRDQELTTLEATFDACASDSVARVVLVTAAAGVGKSRLRFELVRRLRDRDEAPAIWIGRGDPMSAGAPYLMLASALRAALGLGVDEPLAGRRAKLTLRLASRFAGDELTRISEFIGELVGVPLADEPSVRLRAARQDPTLMADQICRAWEDLLAAECAERPLVLVLEDLHWGDLPSVQLVDAALRNLADRPLMILALAHREIRDVFPDLWSQREVQEIRLPGLSKRAAETIVRRALGDLATNAIVTDLVERAAGNAYYLEELIRAIAEGRTGELPATVLAMIEARLTRLSPPQRLALRAASVFGQTFWAGGVAALLGDSTRPSELAARLRELTERELIMRRGAGRFAGQEEYVFRSALVREVAYAMLTEDDRALGHSLAGAWLEGAGEDQAIVIADHFDRGGAAARAIGWYERAARQALVASDLSAAASRASRGAALGAQGAELGELSLLQAEAYLEQSKLAQAYACASAAMIHLPKDSPRWLAASADAACASSRLGDYESLAAIADEISRLTSGASLTGPQAISTARVAIQLLFAGRLGAASALLDRLEGGALAPSERGPFVRAWIHQARAWRELVAGDPSAYLTLSIEARGQFQEAGDERAASNTRVNIAYACLLMGDYAQAATSLEEAVVTARRLGVSPALAEHNLGLALAYLGRDDEALATERSAVSSFVARADRRLEAGGRIYTALILSMASRFPEALDEAKLALECAAHSAPARTLARSTLAHVRRLSGDLEGAREDAKLAMQELTDLGGVDEGDAFIRLVHAEVLEACGARGEATVSAASARERLLGRAAKIQDAAWRESFLARVPENARTLAIAARLCGSEAAPSDQ